MSQHVTTGPNFLTVPSVMPILLQRMHLWRMCSSVQDVCRAVGVGFVRQGLDALFEIGELGAGDEGDLGHRCGLAMGIGAFAGHCFLIFNTIPPEKIYYFPFLLFLTCQHQLRLRCFHLSEEIVKLR